MQVFRYTKLYLRYNVEVFNDENSVIVTYQAGQGVDIVNWEKPSYNLMVCTDLCVVETGKALYPKYMQKYGCVDTMTVNASLVKNCIYDGHIVINISTLNLVAGGNKSAGYPEGGGNSIYTWRG